MSEPKRTKDKKGEKERYERRRKRWWSTWHDAKTHEGPGYKGYTKDPEEDNGFYGHVLPGDFKRTRSIRTHGGI